MAASSERKIEANRRNAARSTGPKSSEGKEKSRRNGYKNGMAAVVVVPVEEAKALEVAIAAWSKQIAPADLAEEALVHQMATADVRMRRCATIAENAMEGDAIAAVRRWENKRCHSIRRKAQDLKKRPAVTVDELEASSFGCDWLIGRWIDLDSRLRLGFSWDEMKLDDALLLLGFEPSAPTAHGDPQARWLWSVAQVAAGWHLNAGNHFKPDPTVPQNWGEARQAIRQFVAEQIERLEGLKQEAWEAIDGPEAEAVAAKALMDGGKEAQARHRYYRDAQLAQHRAAKLLMTMRDRKRKGIVDAPKGVTGAAILEAMCVQVVEQEKAEATERESAASTPRTEPNEAANKAAEERRKPDSSGELRNGTAAGPGTSERRTEPRSAPANTPQNGPATGPRTGLTVPKTPPRSA